MVGGEVHSVEQPVLDDIVLLFERDAGWTQSVESVNPGLQQE